MKRLFLITFLLSSLLSSPLFPLDCLAQSSVAKPYDESIDTAEQVADGIVKAREEGKYVVCQLGGNWCKWCLRFARFINEDPEIKKLVDDNFVYLHVNYNPRNPESADNDATKALLARLNNPQRFGFPVLVFLDSDGKVLHIQDSALLESGEGYDPEKVKRVFTLWSPSSQPSN